MKHMLISAIAATAIAAAATEPLALPAVPATLTTPDERAGYVIAHYWDSLDFADTARSCSPEFMESNFATYATLFPIVSDPQATLGAAAEALFDKAKSSPRAYALLAETADKYLYTPDSPVYDEEHYIPFARAIIADSLLESALLARYEAELADALKNRPGAPAADFAMTTRSGGSTTLGSLISGAKATLLMFYDPDCGDCSRMISELQADASLTDAIKAGRVKVAAVYPESDSEAYSAGAGKIPAQWTDAYNPDGSLADNELYSIRITPSLYLIDSTGTVLMKNARAAEAAAAAVEMK